MVTTTLAVAALCAGIAPGAIATPDWKTDYGTARAAAAAQQKPLAVFIAGGKTGYAELVGGTIPAEATAQLAADYVCLHVDTATPEGKATADKFGLEKGLVVSSKGGDLQALKHVGTVAPTQLTSYLTKYSDPARVVTSTQKVGIVTTAPLTTISDATPAVTYPAPATTYPAAPVMIGGCANGQCGSVMSYPLTPTFGGGCANGRCGIR